MPAKIRIAALLLAVAAVAAVYKSAWAPVVRAAGQVPATTTLDDQVELAVTVYNTDIALVRDVRNLDLSRGTSDLHFMDIAATVNPATVHFRSLRDRKSTRLNSSH